jgi:hypothetical protein
MNIYDIFMRTSPKTPVSLKQLAAIKETHCPDINARLLDHHRRIYHLQQQARQCWIPENRRAEEADVGNYIKYDGTILNTTCGVPTDLWVNKHIYSNNGDPDKVRRYFLDKANAKLPIYRILQDRRYNIVFINEHTIPKYEPRSRTICTDVRTEQFESIERKLRGSYLVLRCRLIEGNQYDLWTLSLRNKKLKQQIATIDGDVIGLGKTKRGSQLSKTIKVGHKITAALS